MHLFVSTSRLLLKAHLWLSSSLSVFARVNPPSCLRWADTSHLQTCGFSCYHLTGDSFHHDARFTSFLGLSVVLESNALLSNFVHQQRCPTFLSLLSPYPLHNPIDFSFELIASQYWQCTIIWTEIPCHRSCYRPHWIPAAYCGPPLLRHEKANSASPPKTWDSGERYSLSKERSCYRNIQSKIDDLQTSQFADSSQHHSEGTQRATRAIQFSRRSWTGGSERISEKPTRTPP